MANGPGPYVNAVPKEGTDPIVKTVTFPTTPIGAQGQGLPQGLRGNGMNIEHVGGTTNGSAKGT